LIRRVLIVGGGSAGYLAALALKTRLPNLQVSVVRSKEIGIIGVGEGSTPALTRFLHEYLAIAPARFFELARPTWKLGLRFLWGPRTYFNYSFNQAQLSGRIKGLRKAKAFYCWDTMEYEDPISALMTQDRAFERTPSGEPILHGSVAYHFENEKFVTFLEEAAAGLGVTTMDETIIEVKRDESGVTGLRMESGREEGADLYIDASGFASLLLGKTLGEPFIDYRRTLYCDRAVVGGWERKDAGEQVIKPYTTCETMESGWCWQIEHESSINRGYVYSSAFISDEAAEMEFRAKNPKVAATRIVRFTSGRYQKIWVKNVVAVGNAGGFVEPLEATALGAIAFQCRTLADTLSDSENEPTSLQQHRFNDLHARAWDEIRNFLAIHYRFNTRLDTPFWRQCRESVELTGAEAVLKMYRDSGPTLWVEEVVDRANQFGIAGYFALLTGQKVPHARIYEVPPDEAAKWNAERERYRQMATRALTVNEALALVRSPKWRWRMG
jgi:tryptophan halogenase